MAEFRWFGHNCVRIRAKEATVITDPVGRATGYQMAKQAADLVTMSHDSPATGNLAAVKLTPPPGQDEPNSDLQVLTGPGEYEIHDTFVTGIRTYRDEAKGAERGRNTVFLIEVEGMKIGHLGNLGHTLTEEQTQDLASVDILIVPAGGGDVLEPQKVAELVGQLEPRIVIPVRYATGQGDRSLGDLEPFTKALGIEVPAAEDKVNVRSADLGETVRLIILNPEGAGAR